MGLNVGNPNPGSYGDPHLNPRQDPLPIPVLAPRPPRTDGAPGLTPNLTPHPAPDVNRIRPNVIASAPEPAQGSALPVISFLD